MQMIVEQIYIYCTYIYSLCELVFMIKLSMTLPVSSITSALKSFCKYTKLALFSIAKK